MIGQTLSHFRITAKLGEGGMGEVYRAEDTKLGREVAIKVLPEAVAGDPERLARFEREAKVLASLNHPHIAAIYSIESATPSHRPGAPLAQQGEGDAAPGVPPAGRHATPSEEGPVHCLVMELVEGEDLRERLARGPIPIKETAQIGLEIASALESAHEKGIVHRDLKPANVKITPDGTAKVLDFGLAKAFEQESDPKELANSPTLTAAATQAGFIMGTAAYMSPEQASGALADRRSDIWSFGVVLSEMLTGKQQFEGETVSHVLASVLKDEPDLEQLPVDVPPRVRRLLERCLSKDPKKRLQSIGEARIVLGEYVADPESFVVTAPPPPAVAESLPAWKRWIPWMVAAALAIALVASLLAPGTDKEPEAPVRRLGIEVDTDRTFLAGYGSSVVLAADGSRVAYVLGDATTTEIFQRPLDQWTASSIHSGVAQDQPYHPFYSPDGQWLGYVTRTEMKKVPVTGGTAITLCPVNLSRGASWGTDGRIVFAPDPTSGLFTVPDVGGEPEPLTELAEGEITHRWPQVLSDRNAVLFTVNTSASDFDKASIDVLDLATGERKTVHHGGYHARYAPSGHLVYSNQGTLFAIGFDLESLEVVGSPAPVLEGVGSNTEQGGANYSLADDGTLAYISGGLSSGANFMVHWMDRAGNTAILWDRPILGRSQRLSPDGRWMAIQLVTDGQRDIWIYDLERDVPMRLTFSEADDDHPVWTPDGESILFSSSRNESQGIYRKAADGTGEAEPLTQSELPQMPTSISPDGSRLVFTETSAETKSDLSMMALGEGAEPEVFLATPFSEYGARFSPDGRWLAYGSDESGGWEIYVRSATGAKGKWQVSAGGGVWPFWSRSSSELFYRGLDGSTWAAQVDLETDSFRASRPQEILEPGPLLVAPGNAMEISPDGERFIVLMSGQEADPGIREELRVVLNWTRELEQKLPRDH